jgi:hypothetical protein
MRSVKVIHLAKADPIMDPIESISIVIDLPIPSRPEVFTITTDIGIFYENQGRQLFDILWRHLPRGTRHQLLIELLKHTEELYRGNK